MKKLLAILLTLAMLVPMCGFAEESAPGVTRTVIFLKDFNAKVLGADIDEAEEKAVNDFLDALSPKEDFWKSERTRVNRLFNEIQHPCAADICNKVLKMIR